jgi:hypothetical protein
LAALLVPPLNHFVIFAKAFLCTLSFLSVMWGMIKLLITMMTTMMVMHRVVRCVRKNFVAGKGLFTFSVLLLCMSSSAGMVNR